MRHAHMVSDEPLTLSDRQHRDHLDLIKCRRVLANALRENRELRQEHAAIIANLSAELSRVLALLPQDRS